MSSHLGGNYQNTSEPVGPPLIKMGNLKRGYVDVNSLDYIINEAAICEDDLCRNGDLFFNTRNTLELVGKVAIWKSELPVAYFNSNILKLQFACNGFMNAWFNSASGRRKLKAIATGTTSVAAIYTRHLLVVQLIYPTLPEQQKIAEFLTAVDEKIGKLKRKKELLEAYKKGAMQKLFSQEIRFKDDQGNPYPDWEEKRLGEVFRRVNTKNKIQNDNVMTISGQHGLINQVEYFNKSVSSKDTSHYTFLKRGQFAYNKSYSKGYPMGAIKRLSRYASGVVSPLYICFELSSKGNDEFFEHFFETGLLNKWIQRIAQEGARNHGLLNVSISEFFSDLPIPTPSLPEQQKIAEFLTGIDDKITAVANRIDKAAEFKQGLLQKMFV